MQKPMRLDEAAFRATLQLVIPDVNNPEKIRGFGSGFLLKHKDHLFFITADHVVHLDDHDEGNETGQRLGIDYTPQIITNIQNKGNLTSVNLPVGGFYHLTGFKMDKEDYCCRSLSEAVHISPNAYAIPGFPSATCQYSDSESIFQRAENPPSFSTIEARKAGRIEPRIYL